LKKTTNTQITVDLDKRQVKAGDLVADFQIDDYVRWRLMEGLDDIGLTLRNESKITEFEKSRPSYKPQTV
jgi:3-isopropylmalate/(R)-2-methylmalate dehydratase small subunit